MSPRLLAFAAALLTAGTSISALAQAPSQPQNDTDDAPQQAVTYASIVEADHPVARWRFEDDKAVAELNGSPWPPQSITGTVKLSQPGPRRQKFPLFDNKNHAALFDKPVSLRYDDPGTGSPLDFAAGDSITL